MKKKFKILLGVFLSIIVIAVATTITIRVVNDENKLTLIEKKWINQSLSTVQNINVVNDLNVFGDNGSGVFYDFINDFSKEYGLKLNPITYNSSSAQENYGFKMTNTIDDNSIVFYEDNFVLLHKGYELITDINDLSSKNIGILNTDYMHLDSYLQAIKDIKYNQYETEQALLDDFKVGEKIQYILVPKTKYISYAIENNIDIVYHFTDIKKYLIYEGNKENNDSEVLSSIIKKYHTKWLQDKLSESYNKALNNVLIKSLNLTDADLKELTSKVYNYGFINNSPYEVIMGGNYGGIIGQYLSKFSAMSNVSFKFTKYRSYKLLTNAINDKNVDIYFNYYTLENEYQSVSTLMNINYYIIAKESNNIIVNSIQSLKNKEVYVLQNSILYNYLSTVDNITIRTYTNNAELEKLSKKDCIILLDQETFEYYANKELKGYNIRYQSSTNSTYEFKIKDTGTFYKLFNAFAKLQDPASIKIEGLYNHSLTIKNGTILGTVAKYSLYIIIAAIAIMYIAYRSTKKITISKKIKKVEKIRYIDQLTSLKNRNYLNENISSWNKNTIYPQATVVIDLNKVQEINDTLGYEQGDSQIKAAANILIKTQLDNTDIMRTDGNEFLIYFVGYDERQVVSYMKKLYKELKNLPYEYGATIGHSMITNDLKSIEDAVNEAVEDMKAKKEETND